MKRACTALLLSVICALPVCAKTPAEILKESPATDWRPLDPQNTLVMDVNGHQVILELAPAFAPKHVANIRTLAHEGYWDGLAIVRVHDNFVTQWGDPNEDDKDKAKSLGSAAAHLPAVDSQDILAGPKCGGGCLGDLDFVIVGNEPRDVHPRAGCAA